MSETASEIELAADCYGYPPARVRARLTLFDRTARLERAARIFLPLLAAALLSLPIPLWHLAAVPGFGIAAVIFALRRLRQAERLEALEGACPACAREQSFPAGGPLRLPLTLRCPGCGEFVRFRERSASFAPA